MTHLPEGAEAEIRDELGYPPKFDDWSFDISPGDGRWKYRFMMFEGAEAYLGTKIFMSLPGRFSNIPGISEVEQEDRESYLMNSTLDPDELGSRLWKAFQAAAAESFEK